MQYVKFASRGQAEEYQQRLQAYHDGQAVQRPRVIDCIIETWDGMFALTLLDEGVPPDVGTGEIVESINSPNVEME